MKQIVDRTLLKNIQILKNRSMKILYLCCSLYCMLAAQPASSQVEPPLNQHPVEKAALFAQLPEKISIPASSLQHIFSAALNSNLSVALGAQARIEGTVIAKCAVSPEQLSINIRCNNFQNALLNISRITEQDGSFTYIGRIVSMRHGDVLLLWEDKGQYSFIRQKQLLSMVE